MFELWKVIKRNPTFYNPRLVGLAFLAYVLHGAFMQARFKVFSDMVFFFNFKQKSKE